MKKSVCQNTKQISTTPEKQSVVSQKESVVSQKESVVYTNLQIQTEFKELNDRAIEHTGLYWFTLNQKLHSVFSETSGESTKQSTLDYLQHHQRSDLDPLKTHTSFGSAQHH